MTKLSHAEAVARKYSVHTEIIDIFTQAAKSGSMMKMLLKLNLNIVLRPQKDSDLALENLALRQQLAILKRQRFRPPLSGFFSYW